MRARRSYRLGRNELAELQRKRLRRALAHAYRTSPYYHDMLKRRSVDPQSVGLDGLARLPAMDKSTVLAAGASLLSTRVKPALSRKTTGTTGDRAEFFMDGRYIDIHWGLGFRRNWMAGIPFLAKGAQITLVENDRWTYFGTKRTYPFKSVLGTVDAEMTMIRTVQIARGARSIQEAARAMSRSKVSVLKGKGSLLVAIGRAMEQQGVEAAVEHIIAGAEVLYPATRRQLETIYRGRVTANYGSTEVGKIGGECAAQSGVHVFTDYHIMEVLKGEEPASPGEEGEVTLTTMFNDSMPLVRYRTGDIATVSEDEKCSCGSYLPRLKFIIGRKQDLLLREDGISLSPVPVVEFIDTLLGPVNYELVQRRAGDFLLSTSVPVSRPAMGSIEAFLRSIVGGEVTIGLGEWEGVQVAAKYRPFRSAGLSPEA